LNELTGKFNSNTDFSSTKKKKNKRKKSNNSYCFVVFFL